MKKTLAAALLAALALALTSCGGNDDDTQAAQSISDSIMKQQKSGGTASQFFTMKRKDADCIGKGFVDKIGTDQLKKDGVLTQDNKVKQSVTNVKMSASEAKAATDVLFSCTNVENMMQTAMNKSGNVPAAMKDCVNKVLTEANLRPMFEKVFQGQQDEAQKALIGPMMKCATGNQG